MTPYSDPRHQLVPLNFNVDLQQQESHAVNTDGERWQVNIYIVGDICWTVLVISSRNTITHVVMYSTSEGPDFESCLGGRNPEKFLLSFLSASRRAGVVP
jgi:hypothetical protein